MSLKLLDAIVRETTGFPAIVQVSDDGSKLFAVYEITIDPESTTLAAELFDISSGKLKSLATFDATEQFNEGFLNVDSGAASSDFCKFSLVLDDWQGAADPANPALGRMRVLLLKRVGDELVVEVTETFGDLNSTELVVQGYTPLGGTFVDDDQAIVVTAVTSPVTIEIEPGTAEHSTLWLLNSTTLKTLSKLTVEKVFTQAAVALDTKHHSNYFAITTSQGALDFQNLPGNWDSPHQLEVYRVKDCEVKLVAEQELPQGALSIAAAKVPGGWKLFVGTTTALLETQKATIPVPNELNTSADTEGKEFLEFLFTRKGKELALIGSYNTDSSIDGIAYASESETIFISQLALPQPEYGPSFFTFGRFNCDQFENLAFPRATGGLVNFALNNAETRLVVGSASTNYNGDEGLNPVDSDLPIYNNLLLYKFTA